MTSTHAASRAAKAKAAPTPAQVAWVVFCVVAMVAILAARDISRTDFRTFYDSALAWRTGGPTLYPDADMPNLNPPWLSIVAAPLTVFPLRTAFFLWSAIGAGLITLSLLTLQHAFPQPLGKRFWITGAMIAAMPCAMVWAQGQVTWMLLLPFTQAWAASHERPWKAGLWLAPVVALKPQLGLMAALLPLPIAIAAGLGVALITGAGVLATGIQPWQEWLSLSHQVGWLGHPENGSLWGPIARAIQGDIVGLSIYDVSPVMVAALGVLGLVFAVSVYRTRDTDRRWVLAMLWITMFSPLGWLYYLPLLVAPAVVGWPGTWWSAASLGLLCFPLRVLWPLVHGPLGASLVGAIYPLGVAAAFFAWSRRQSPSPRGL